MARPGGGIVRQIRMGWDGMGSDARSLLTVTGARFAHCQRFSFLIIKKYLVSNANALRKSDVRKRPVIERKVWATKPRRIKVLGSSSTRLTAVS